MWKHQSLLLKVCNNAVEVKGNLESNQLQILVFSCKNVQVTYSPMGLLYEATVFNSISNVSSVTSMFENEN